MLSTMKAQASGAFDCRAIRIPASPRWRKLLSALDDARGGAPRLGLAQVDLVKVLADDLVLRARLVPQLVVGGVEVAVEVDEAGLGGLEEVALDEEGDPPEEEQHALGLGLLDLGEEGELLPAAVVQRRGHRDLEERARVLRDEGLGAPGKLTAGPFG